MESLRKSFLLILVFFKASFLVLLFSATVYGNDITILSVIYLLILAILLSTLDVMRHLTCYCNS